MSNYITSFQATSRFNKIRKLEQVETINITNASTPLSSEGDTSAIVRVEGKVGEARGGAGVVLDSVCA